MSPVPVQVVGPALLTVTPTRNFTSGPLMLSGPLRLNGLPLSWPPVQLTAAPLAVASMARPPESGKPEGMVRAAPAPRTVRPPPAWVPPVQVIAPLTVRSAAPVSVPPLSVKALLIVEALAKLKFPPDRARLAALVTLPIDVVPE